MESLKPKKSKIAPEELSEFARAIAHEINSPLALISGLSSRVADSIIDNRFDAKSALSSLNSITESSQRISKIIYGLLALHGVASVEPLSRTSLKSMIKETLEVVSERYRTSEARVEIQISTDFEVFCNAVQICQVMGNLISNSYDAVESLDEKWIQISAKCVDGEAYISVTDSGRGIPKEMLQKMKTLHFTSKAPGRGSGIGLGISKKLAEASLGELWYDSEKENTTFTLRLKIAG